jgi:hypothetical protein
MHFPTRNCTPIVSAATGRISQRGAAYASPWRFGSAGLKSCAGKNGFIVSSRNLRSFSGICIGKDVALKASATPVTRPGCVWPAALPRDHTWIQSRSFSKADHTLVPKHDQKTEELLEKFEVQEGKQPSEGGEGKRASIKEKCPQRMTKGSNEFLFLVLGDDADFWK